MLTSSYSRSPLKDRDEQLDTVLLHDPSRDASLDRFVAANNSTLNLMGREPNLMETALQSVQPSYLSVFSPTDPIAARGRREVVIRALGTP